MAKKIGSEDATVASGPRSLIGPSLTKTGIFEAITATHPVASSLVGEDPKTDAGKSSAMPRALRIEREGTEPLIVPLHPDRTYVFGRAPESSFVFPSDAVSRLHAQLRHDGEKWMYRDLNSLNGSFLVLRAPKRGEDPRRASRKIGADSEHAVRAGQTLLLANRWSRLVFLDEIPAGVAEPGRPGEESSPATRKLEHSIDICARHRLPVFLLGPSGCGKTFVARTIHERSRMEGQFVILNCGRLPRDPAQLTSELLGHIKGSFTGAITERRGKLWVANNGTLFLDEVDSLSPEAQDFLLDVLEGSGSYAPFGCSGETGEPPPRFRLISASKIPLAQSSLRRDLCQRLATGDMIVLPTLAERRDDIPALIEIFLSRLRAEQQINAELSQETMRLLQENDWPGEIRELESTVKTVVSREHAARQLDGIASKKIIVSVAAARTYLDQRRQGFGSEVPRPAVTMAVTTPERKRPSDLTAEEIRAALERNGGNKTRAASYLGIALNTLKAKMRTFGIDT